MSKRVLIFCAFVAQLSACAAGNTGAKLSISHVALPALGAAQPAPIVLPPPCPANLRAPLMAEPQLPDDAFFPAPETAEAAAPVARYFVWLHAHEAWARAGWARAADALGYCGAP